MQTNHSKNNLFTDTYVLNELAIKSENRVSIDKLLGYFYTQKNLDFHGHTQ